MLQVVKDHSWKVEIPEEKKIQKTRTDDEVKDAHKVTAFEGLKFREVKKDENVQKDAEKLAGTKLVSVMH